MIMAKVFALPKGGTFLKNLLEKIQNIRLVSFSLHVALVSKNHSKFIHEKSIWRQLSLFPPRAPSVQIQKNVNIDPLWLSNTQYS